MAGLISALNIAKNALLNFQLATQVITHNISNVNNENYSRQKVIETTYPPEPSFIGPIGRGAKIEKIIRYFDIFLEKNINLKKTDYGMYSAEETGLTILESYFNETNESGLLGILKDFWNAWQNLANYPESFPARSEVIEYGKLIAESLKTKFQGMKDLEDQINVKLQELVERINTLVSQIASLNQEIIAQEVGGKSANDLRDKRDQLVAELSQLVDIQYFETKEGAYNIVLEKGFNLVNLNQFWKLEVSGKGIYWIGPNNKKILITSKEITSGELGGWLRLLEQISDEYNYEYVSGDESVYTLTGEPITESTTFNELGIATGTFTFSGMDHFGNSISGSFTVSTGNETIGDLLNAIEFAFNYTVDAYIKDGRLFIEDLYRGPGELSFSITGPVDFGNFDDPAYQRRVEEINLAGELKIFGEELIKAVNSYYTQGVGLTFFTRELEGVYSVNQYIKELPYFLDLKKDSSGTQLSGFFYIWIKDPIDKITPVKVNLNGVSINATLTDLQNVINSALQEAGFYRSASDWDIQAIVRNGKLVIQAKDNFSFAFSNDTCGILLATGLNVFFVGKDPIDFKVNPILISEPELVSSGKMDPTAFRSKNPLFGTFKSNTSVDPTYTGFEINRLYINFYNEKGEKFSVPPEPFYEATYTTDVLLDDVNIYIKDANGNILKTITLNSGTKISELPKILDGSEGVKATVENGILKFELNLKNAPPDAVYFTVDEGTSGINTLIEWDETFSSYAININSTDTLQEIIDKLDRLPYLRAYIDSNNYLILTLEPNQTTAYGFEIGEYFTGTTPSSTTSFVEFLNNENMHIPAFRWDGINITRVMTGLEDFNLNTTYENYLSFYLFDEKGNPIDTDTATPEIEPFRIDLNEILNLANNKTLFDLLQMINAPENVQWGISARLDREGKLIIETTGLYNTRSFIAQDEIDDGSGIIQAPYNYGIINNLSGYILDRGDNRIAQIIADIPSQIRESLGLTTLDDYYSNIIKDIGIATKTVKENKEFIEEIIKQLKTIKESISGVSLDEEMTELIKYQQAFIASAKVLTTVEDMLQALLEIKE